MMIIDVLFGRVKGDDLLVEFLSKSPSFQLFTHVSYVLHYKEFELLVHPTVTCTMYIPFDTSDSLKRFCKEMGFEILNSVVLETDYHIRFGKMMEFRTTRKDLLRFKNGEKYEAGNNLLLCTDFLRRYCGFSTIPWNLTPNQLYVLLKTNYGI